MAPPPLGVGKPWRVILSENWLNGKALFPWMVREFAQKSAQTSQKRAQSMIKCSTFAKFVAFCVFVMLKSCCLFQLWTTTDGAFSALKQNQMLRFLKSARVLLGADLFVRRRLLPCAFFFISAILCFAIVRFLCKPSRVVAEPCGPCLSRHVCLHVIFFASPPTWPIAIANKPRTPYSAPRLVNQC